MTDPPIRASTMGFHDGIVSQTVLLMSLIAHRSISPFTLRSRQPWRVPSRCLSPNTRVYRQLAQTIGYDSTFCNSPLIRSTYNFYAGTNSLGGRAHDTLCVLFGMWKTMEILDQLLYNSFYTNSYISKFSNILYLQNKSNRASLLHLAYKGSHLRFPLLCG